MISFSLKSLLNISRDESVLEEKLRSLRVDQGTVTFRVSANLVLFQMVSGPLRALRKVIVNELRFVCKHMGRKSNEIIFMKCVEPRCPHCKDRPIISKNAWSYMLEREFKWANYQTFVITKLFMKLRIWILTPYKHVHNIAPISNMLPYKQVHNFVLKRKMLTFLL